MESHAQPQQGRDKKDMMKELSPEDGPVILGIDYCESWRRRRISPDLNILVIGQYCFPLVELGYFIEEHG